MKAMLQKLGITHLFHLGLKIFFFNPRGLYNILLKSIINFFLNKSHSFIQIQQTKKKLAQIH